MLPEMAVTLLTIPEVATRSKLSEKTIRRLIARGELVACKVGGRWRVRESDCEAWLDRGRVVPLTNGRVVPGRTVPVRGSLDALREIEAAA